MAQFDEQTRVLRAKIVYYGPPLSGKTTNLISLHKAVDHTSRTRLFSLNTREDRTLFFDMMPLEIGRILDYTLRLQIYTVPGQVHYKATRRMLLQGADALVFVASSDPKATGDNLASLLDLRDNLTANDMEYESLPMIFQYNKRDLPDPTPIEELEQTLNVLDAAHITAVARTGQGVVETLRHATEILVSRLLEKYGGRGADTPAARESGDLVESVFHKFLQTEGEKVTRRAVPEWVRTYPRATDDSHEPIEVYGDLNAAPMLDVEPPGDESVQVLEPEELLEESLRTQMRIAEDYGALEKERAALEEAIQEQDSAATEAFSQAVEAEEQRENLLNSLNEDLHGPLESLAETVERIAAETDPETQKEQLDSAREESQRLRSLVREILNARQEREEVEGVSFYPVLDTAHATCRDRIARKNVQLDTEVEEDLPALSGEEARLVFALKNVLATAIQAAPAGSRIRLRAAFKEMALERHGKPDVSRRFVVVQVRDFSEGLPKEIWEKIFQDAPDGTRSAMATSREILRRAGGLMQVKSKKGKGNLITLYIPVADTAEVPLTAERTA